MLALTVLTRVSLWSMARETLYIPKYSWFSNIETFRAWVLFSWLLLALQVKVGKVASFVGKIFVVRPSVTKTTNILPHENYSL